MVDIPGDATTTTSVTVGSITINTLETVGDHDWLRINLVAGQAITVSLDGLSPSLDPYLYIRNSSGQIIHENDDIHTGVDLDSQVSFAAPTTGIYYIDVGSWNNASAGDYRVTVTAFQTPPVYTNDQIANQLATGYWGDGPHPLNVASGGSVTVNVSGLTDASRNLALQALQTWSEITGINFVQTTSPTPTILFDDDDPDGGAFTEIRTVGGTSIMFVNVDVQWLMDFGPNIGSYTYQAYIHEIGHALGLGHAGNYNTTATYPYDALFQNDSWATSVMSYFSQAESSYFSSRGFSELHVVTPMVADILAVQQLYGLSTTTRSGDTTYGFNSNAGGVYDASVYPISTIAYTIFDTGGIDTLDYSNTFTGQQLINLNPETFSNVGGRTGNVTIARGTIIENAIGSDSRPDTIIGNSANNTLTGGGHNDTLTGGAGADTFLDSLAGLSGDTITDFSAGDRIVFTDATLATFTFNLTGHTLTYSGGSLTLTGVTGTIVAAAAAGGGVQLSLATTSARYAGDFNGDGRSDLLLRHDDGWMTEWLGQPNGSFSDNGAIAGNWIHPGWQVVAIGDFNGDTRDDLLLRHSDGTVIERLAQPNGSFVANGAATSWLHPSWDVVLTGDFNGDTRDDLLLRHSDGTVVEWLGQANGSFAGNAAATTWLHPAWNVASTGDFNGDGEDDLLLRHSDGTIVEWLGQSNGSFAGNGAATVWLHPAWDVASVGDFNGDTREDLLLRHSDGTIVEWLGQANGSFASNGAATVWLHPAWEVAMSGDFNGDTRDDLLLRHSDGTIVEWLGQANGSFAGNAAATTWVNPQWHLQPADIF